MLRLLYYYLYSLRYPHLRDFIDMGLGIEARHERCEAAWYEHLERSKKFQEKCFDSEQGDGELIICGAGRGLDIAAESVMENFSEIRLFDADPLCKKQCMKLFSKDVDTTFYVAELSGSLNKWNGELNKLNPNQHGEKEICKFLSSLKASQFEFAPRNIKRTVLSLNLLSQIPIYWRSKVQKVLAKKFNIQPDAHDNLPSPYQEALSVSCAELQRAHLSSLQSSGAEEIICIYDTSFVYTQNGKEILRESAVYIDVEGELKEYTRIDLDSWIWNIAPQEIEFKKYGIYHEVRAARYVRAH